MRINKKELLANLKKPEVHAYKLARKSEIPMKVSLAVAEVAALKEQMMSVSARKYAKVGKPVGEESIKILSLSDLHVPFENYDVIVDALKKHGDADILVVNGDFLEQYAVSKWGKSKTVLLEWEYKVALEWLKLFSSMFEEVHLVRGNHDDRLRKYIDDSVDPMIGFMINNDVLTKLAEGYDFNAEGKLEQKHDFDNVYYQGGLLGWYTKIGECIFAHPSSFSGVPMRTVINAATSFMSNEDFQAIVIGHTHKIGKLIWRDKLLIEQGCCCVPMDYQADGKLKYLPQAFGYAIVYMDEKGNVDFDKSNTVYCGTGYPTKFDL